MNPEIMKKFEEFVVRASYSEMKLIIKILDVVELYYNQGKQEERSRLRSLVEKFTTDLYMTFKNRNLTDPNLRRMIQKLLSQLPSEKDARRSIGGRTVNTRYEKDSQPTVSSEKGKSGNNCRCLETCACGICDDSCPCKCNSQCPDCSGTGAEKIGDDK